MKIIVFTGYFYPHKGGLESFVLDLAKRLSKKHQVTVVCPNTDHGRGEETSDALRILRLPAIDFMKVYPIVYSTSKLSELEAQDIDLVITNMRFFQTSLMGMKFSQKNKIRWLHIEHGTSFVRTNSLFLWLASRFFDLTFRKKILNEADKVVAVSDEAGEFIRRLSKNKNPVVIHNGIELETIPRQKKTGLNKNLIFVGRTIYGKGIQDLLVAFSKIKQRGLRLTIVGDGPYKARLNKLAHSLHIQDRIIFAGEKAREDVLRLLSESDIFINPSYSEGLSISILEAGAVGLPVIATDVGGTKELIIPHQTGLLIPPKNPAALREAIEYVLENPDQTQKLAGNLNRLVRTSFGWGVLIQKWEKEIEGREDENSVLHGFG